MPDAANKIDVFNDALRQFQVEQWLMSQRARSWRTSAPADLRQFADHAKRLGGLFDTLIADAGALVAAEPELEGLDELTAEYAASVRAQADRLDADARERADEPLAWSPRLEEFV